MGGQALSHPLYHLTSPRLYRFFRRSRFLSHLKVKPVKGSGSCMLETQRLVCRHMNKGRDRP